MTLSAPAFSVLKVRREDLPGVEVGTVMHSICIHGDDGLPERYWVCSGWQESCPNSQGRPTAVSFEDQFYGSHMRVHRYDGRYKVTNLDETWIWFEREG